MHIYIFFASITTNPLSFNSPSITASLITFMANDNLKLFVCCFRRNDSCDPQLGDTWWGMQGKMSVTAPVKKIRKKSDSKPQSQMYVFNVI